MKYRIIKWQDALYIVLGISYNNNFDPPDTFYAVKLQDTLLRSVLLNMETVIIPFSEAVEITDKETIQAIWILYGG